MACPGQQDFHTAKAVDCTWGRLTSVKHAKAHLLVIYANMPPKFRTWWKLNELIPWEGASVGAAPAVDGRAAPEEEPEENAVDIIFILPFPVASAITLPLALRPIMLSSRSGTVTKAKDPARAIIRGKAMKRSLGERLIKDELFDSEDMVEWKSGVNKRAYWLSVIFVSLFRPEDDGPWKIQRLNIMSLAMSS